MPSQVPGSRHGVAGPFVLLSSALALVKSFLAICLILSFWNRNVYSVQYTLEVYSFIFILQELALKRLP